MNNKTANSALYDELAKLGAITDDHARRAIDQLDALEHNKPTLGQVGRYAAPCGAAAGPVVGAIGNAIRGRGTFDMKDPLPTFLSGAKQPGFGGKSGAPSPARPSRGPSVPAWSSSSVASSIDTRAMSTLNDLHRRARCKEQNSPMMKGEQEPVLHAEPKVGGV